MKSQTISSWVRACRCGAERILLEAALTALVGAIFAFAANEISPGRLDLTRNYFPTGTNNMVRTAPAVRPFTGNRTNSAMLAVEQPAAAQLIDREQAVRFFQESQSKRDIVFVDARDESHYRGAHIPGAQEFDPFNPERYFPDVLPICQAMEKIVVYCSGGDCDDSGTAALLLKDVGIPVRKLFIYPGGIAEWTNNNLPVENGPLPGGKGQKERDE